MPLLCPIPTTFLREALGNQSVSNPYRHSLTTLITPTLESEPDHPSLLSLPTLVATCYGVASATLTALTAAWRCLYLAVKVIDDVEDGESPAARTLNQGLGLLWVTYGTLERSFVESCPHTRHAVMSRLHETLLRACAGQQSDVTFSGTLPTAYTPDDWLAIAEHKSGVLLEWAAWSAAWLATENSTHADAFGRFGRYVGILLQAVDDFEGVWGSGAADLTTGALSLPLSYAYMILPPPEQRRLTALLLEARQGNTLAVYQTQAWLTELGAREFMWVASHTYAHMAYEAIATLSAPITCIEPLCRLLTTLFPAFDNTVTMAAGNDLLR